METLLQINIPIGMSRLADDSLTTRTTKDFGRRSKGMRPQDQKADVTWVRGPSDQRAKDLCPLITSRYLPEAPGPACRHLPEP
jgi:hypothetical protein